LANNWKEKGLGRSNKILTINFDSFSRINTVRKLSLSSKTSLADALAHFSATM